MSRGVIDKPFGLFGPIVKVGTGIQRASSRHPQIVSGNADRDRTASVRADQDDARHHVRSEEMHDGVALIVNPLLQQEVALTGSPGGAPQRTSDQRRVEEQLGHQVAHRHAHHGESGDQRHSKSRQQDHHGEQQRFGPVQREVAAERER